MMSCHIPAFPDRFGHFFRSWRPGRDVRSRRNEISFLTYFAALQGNSGTRLRAAICGVAGYNRGDDAIAVALAEGILARVSDARIDIAVLTAVSLARSPSIRPFLAARSRPAGLIGIILAIARSDLVVLGGGSLIQDRFGGDRVKGVMGYAWLVSWLAAIMGKRLVTAPLGIDALHSRRAEGVAAEILRRCRQITVRDARSLTNALALVPGKEPPPRRVPDPAFGLSGMPQPVADDAPIVLAPAFEGEFDDFVAEVFAQVAIGCAMACDRPIVIVAMDDRQEQDAGRIGTIRRRLPPHVNARVTLAVPTDLEEALALLRGSAGIVAMRLHAMILGYGFAPISCLSRTTKTDAFMEDYYVPGLPAMLGEDPRTIAAHLIDGVMNWRERAQQERKRQQILEELESYYADLVHGALAARH